MQIDQHSDDLHHPMNDSHPSASVQRIPVESIPQLFDANPDHWQPTANETEIGNQIGSLLKKVLLFESHPLKSTLDEGALALAINSSVDHLSLQ